MAFAEGGKGTEYVPTCHDGGRKCKGGWLKCRHITDEHRAKVAALDDAGHFRRSNNNSTNKKGTVNVVAAADKDGEDDGSKDSNNKTDSSATSTLTEDMMLGELLKLTSVINTTVGMDKRDGVIYEEDGSWDGDVLSNIDLGFCQVQDEKLLDATVIKEPWLVQGRRGTNPLNNKNRIKKEALPTLKV